jgi:hypothetical protein
MLERAVEEVESVVRRSLLIESLFPSIVVGLSIKVCFFSLW